MFHLGRHTSAAVSALGGSALLAYALVVMNTKVHQPPKADNQLVADVAVEKKKQPPKKKEVQKPKPKPRPSRARPAPRPNFSAGLGGLGGGIPVFSAGDLAGLAGDGLSELETTKDMVMTEDTVDSQPERISGSMPQPPNRAVRQRIGGFVKVRVQVTADGRLEAIHVVEAQPEGVFEDSVKTTLAQWKMEPAKYAGRAVAMSAEYTFRFQL